MSTHKLRDAKGVSCGCEYTRDSRDNEMVSRMCMEHELEFTARHAAAVASCSHSLNQDLVG